MRLIGIVGCLIGCGYFAVLGAEQCVLQKTPIVSKITFYENQIYYTVDFYFSVCPRDYWVYYDHKIQKMVLDIYGAHIRVSYGSIRESLVENRIEVRNINSSMSLSGMQTQVLFDVDKFWHAEAFAPDSSKLRVFFWKQTTPPKIKPSKETPMSYYIIGAAGVGFTTFFSLFLLIKS